MPLDRLLAPAIELAEHGFPIDQRQAEIIGSLAALWAQYPESAKSFMPLGRPPRAGEILVLPGVAAGLRAVAEGGAPAFYSGPIAATIVAALEAGGSRYTVAEFAAHQAELYEPIRARYRGHDILETRPVSQGVVVLEALNLLDGFELTAPLDPAAIHLQVEAVRLAFADRLRYVGDPRFVESRVETLVSREFAARRRAAIDPRRAGPAESADHFDLDGDTTSFVVADAAGWAVSFIHSISATGGSGFSAGGILLNNRIARGFSLEPGHPNELAGGKRTQHTLNCWQIHRGGRPVYIGGTPGGDGQPQWNVQVICDLLDYGMNVQQATEWPRWMAYPATDPATMANPRRLDLDGRFPAETVEALAAIGHPVRRTAPWDPGRIGAAMQLIHLDPESGVLSAGSDPRGAGLAIAF
jgi:gamma-glutamyltranspeptidase/glutathione hydrolase